MTSHNSLNSLLSGNQSDQLRQITAHAKLLRRINAQLHTALDPVSAEHCSVANLREQTLILQTTSPAWASRLRFHIPELLSMFKSSSISVQEIQIKIVPETQKHTTSEQHSEPQFISGETATLLESVADDISNNELKSSLRRLSKRLTPDKT